MKQLLITSMICATVSLSAFAAGKSEAIYLNQSGAQVDAQTAILSSARGELTYKCNPQEFKVSKSGNSISIRNKKKKLTKEEIAEQMKELSKRAE